MDRDEHSDLDSFMELVETGERRVYLEYPTAKQILFKLFAPVVAGFCITLCFVFGIAFFQIVIHPLLILTGIFAPITIGFLVGLVSVVRSSRNAEQYGVRGIPRPELSSTINFLDMIAEGIAELGEIPDDEKPEEFGSSSSIILGTTLKVLNKIDPGLGTRWFQTLSTSLSQATGLLLKVFLRVAVFGTLIISVFVVALQILGMLGFIDSLLFLQILIPTGIIAVVLVIALAGYAIKNRNADPPLEIQEALRGPEIRTETTYVLDHLLTVLIEEGKYPLRLLVLGDYSDLQYTGRTYLTSREVSLREAVLIPRFARL